MDFGKHGYPVSQIPAVECNENVNSGGHPLPIFMISEPVFWRISANFCIYFGYPKSRKSRTGEDARASLCS